MAIQSKPKQRPRRQKPWPAAGLLPSGNSSSLRRKAKKQGANAGEGSLPEAFDLLRIPEFIGVVRRLMGLPQILSEVEANPSVSRRKQHMLDKEELVKEKIILSQESSIRQLNMLVQSLQRQLLHCRGSNKTTHGTESSLTENVNEVEKQLILED